MGFNGNGTVRVTGAGCWVLSVVSHATRRRGLGVSPSPAHALHEPDDLGRPSRPVRFDELRDADAAHLQKFATRDSLTRVSNRRLWSRKKLLHSGFWLKIVSITCLPPSTAGYHWKLVNNHWLWLVYYIVYRYILNFIKQSCEKLQKYFQGIA